MIELSITEVTLTLLGGATLGVIFFGGLWFTVHKLATSTRPALLMTGSMLLRFGIVLLAFYGLVTFVHWQALLVALVGFIFARFVVMRLGAIR